MGRPPSRSVGMADGAVGWAVTCVTLPSGYDVHVVGGSMSRFGEVRANLRRAYKATRETIRANGQPDPVFEEGNDVGRLDMAEEPAIVSEPSVMSRDDREVPYGLRIAAAWS